VRVPELTLDDRQRNPLVGHLDRVSMPQLVGCEPPPDTACAARRRSSPRQLSPTNPATGRPDEDTEQRTNRQPDAVLGPASDVLPAPIVHPDHPSLPALN
jgi:hypothetical protein